MSRTVAPARLQPGHYPFLLPIEPQFTDMDVAGHLNNIAIARFYESARARLNLEIFGRDVFRRGAPHLLVLAETKLRFLAEGSYPDTVQVGCGVPRVGTSSFVVHQALFQSGRCLGVSDCVLVVTADGRPHAIPPALRAAMEPWLTPESAAI